jgi:hypothetical protein
MKPFDKIEFFSRLWMNLTKMNIDPRTLVIEHYFDPMDGEVVRGSLHKNKTTADYFAFKIDPETATDPNVDYWGLAADRAAFALENRRFPKKIDWAVAFEKELDKLQNDSL